MGSESVCDATRVNHLTIDYRDNVWLTDVALQQVYEFSPSGQLLLTLGERGVAGLMPGISIARRRLPLRGTDRFM